MGQWVATGDVCDFAYVNLSRQQKPEAKLDIVSFRQAPDQVVQSTKGVSSSPNSIGTRECRDKLVATEASFYSSRYPD